MDTPVGFVPYPNQGPFLEHVGPIHVHEDGDGPPALGVRAEERHANHRGTIQGGFLATFADFALGRAIEFNATDERERATVSLTVDFLKPAEPGDWIEAETNVDRVGSTLSFADCTLRARRARVSSRKSRIRRRRLMPDGDTLDGMTVWRLSGGIEPSFPPSLAAGVVNVTSDSFYAGARSVTPERAIEDGLRLAEAGFDLLDVGAVAARSGPPVETATEIESLAPAITGLAECSGVPVMADTFEPEVARSALDAGAVAINDISGSSVEMYELVAERGCGDDVMHIEPPLRLDRTPTVYVTCRPPQAWFAERIERMAGRQGRPRADRDRPRAGLRQGRGRHDRAAGANPRASGAWKAGHGGDLAQGLSRRRHCRLWEARPGADERGAATLAAVTLATAQGAEILRLHDPEALDAMRMAAAIAPPGARSD